MINLVVITISLIILLISLTIHEAAHAFTSYWLGDDTARLSGRLTLNPLKHIDPFMTILLPVSLILVGSPVLFGGAKPVPFNPNNVKFGEGGVAMVAFAGPLSNLIIAFVSVGVWALFDFTQVGIANDVFTSLISINLGFFIFNMIPIPPLDGSRLLYSLAPDFVRKTMDYIERFGVMFVFIIIILLGSVFNNLIFEGVNYIFTVFVNFFSLMK